MLQGFAGGFFDLLLLGVETDSGEADGIIGKGCEVWSFGHDVDLLAARFTTGCVEDA
uniref:Uncharacterized protein n=1 Tax=Candidatus Kentrum eta TaxID=2126337 RepID=A0A450URT7_9GAMM|nr:MAG: hypothetical protein BECKH772A_GA0070896_100719 [Candidatus Kentron sp. H]VFJ95258.1 MAG: hypothetical protein BECKH772B_GA0070898_100749 [Candidatus Kentron sp. H]VFK01652.1 MAG: hypothetical protein BECKH772C_GA0070978_100709 [Candidatus Kentron sp. H]